ncbi:mechanosensitive ion channel family protein [Rugamonas aquatica]|uniref:Small-conductance mechanosensitive channel n=1 Tax=Rugamonas aquatica TaxID=2743357 RepID=A0A6A7MY47_9BURK|nr:mechanosensitive ion channel family protein [Rugamonas aquatica]MQA37655.1 mechanosensitive ion channel [Rugamonas aquatica]
MLTIDGPWINPWHAGLVAAVLFCSVMQLLLTRSDPDSPHLFRNNLLFGGLCLILSLSSKLMINMEQRQAAGLFESASMLGFGLLLIRILGLTAFRVLLPALRMHPPRIMEDILLVLTYIVWGLVWLRVAGLDLSGLVTTSAVITGVVAFSMQETLGNILGGLALQLDNSVRIGDWIKVDDVRGKVVEVHWRHTAVRTNNGSLIVIPNSVLMKSKVDVYSRESKPEFRRWVNFWIEDGVPPQQVIATVQAALRQTHIAHISSERPPECIVTDYREGLIQYAVRYWLTNPAHDDGTDSAVRIHFYSALQRQSMSLAHPCMDIRLNTDTERRSSARLAAEMDVRKQALAKVALFSGLTEEELAKLAKALRNTPFVKDDIITRQGAVAHWLYLLVGGEADVWFEVEGQERVYCATLKAGDVFGEIGLLTGAPRGATVTAKTDVLCYRLDKENFASILQERPELADQFAHVLSDRNQVLNAIRTDHAEPEQAQQATYLEGIRRFFRLH